MCPRRFAAVLLLFLVLSVLPANGLFLQSIFGPDPELSSNCQGLCNLCAMCWITGGYNSGSCGGLYVCCQSYVTPVAEARKIDEMWGNYRAGGNYLDEQPLPEVHYGPVINDPMCGVSQISRRRVVGGQGAGFGRFPWQALVYIGKSRCGGALINRQHVVTAAHCLKKARIGKISVLLGEYMLGRHVEPLLEQNYSAIAVSRHPYYKFTPQADRFDVAVIKLDRPVTYRPHIIPICLPEKTDQFAPGTMASVAGWGATNPGSKDRPSELQSVEVSVVNSTLCEKWHEKKHRKVRIYDDMMCAGYEEGEKDACQGDSGGPLMTQATDGRWMLIGLVSAGYSCALPGQPGIYHRVTTSSTWISYTARP